MAARRRVVEQVPQLLFDVAVVDVERRDPCAVRAEHALDVLVAVVHVEREVVLSRLPTLELGAFGVTTEPTVVQVVAEAACAPGQVGVAEAPIPPDEGLAVRIRRGDDLVDLGQVEIHGRASYDEQTVPSSGAVSCTK